MCIRDRGRAGNGYRRADYSAGHDGPFFLPEEFSQTGQAGTNGGKKPASSCDRVFHLLFSVGDETGGFAEDIDSQRAGGERNSDLAAACNCGSGLSVVRDAGYRAGGCHSRNSSDAQIWTGAAGSRGGTPLTSGGGDATID